MSGREKIPVPTEKYWERLPNVSREFLVETVDNLLAEQDHNNLKLCTANLVDSLPSKEWRADKPSLLEVVDPMLHCYVSGVTTKKLPDRCDFEKPCGKKESSDNYYSEKFQLIPAEFYSNPNSKKVTIRSYINNLDPRHYGKVYESIEQIVAAALPHFEKVLTDLVQLDQNNNNATVTLSGRPLQIIVGIKNIHLTPKTSPKYPGSKWHTEGLRNERIVASGIYYYDVGNITESQLAFRVKTDGTSNRTDLGYITAQSNRLVVFPNIYEHSVKPFQLESSSQSGYRKFITLFLVDPTTKIISTAAVSPQQKSWYPIDEEHSNRLFPPTGTQVFSTSGTMTLENARQFRDDGRAERGIKTVVTKSHSRQSKRRPPAKKAKRERSRGEKRRRSRNVD